MKSSRRRMVVGGPGFELNWAHRDCRTDWFDRPEGLGLLHELLLSMSTEVDAFALLWGARSGAHF
jgi:hypothetical protein